MRILFINAPSVFPVSPLPPLGVGFLASILEEKGCEVRIIDLQVETRSLEEEIRTFEPLCVGITSVTSTYPSAIKIASAIKSFWNGPLIMGGHHVSFRDREALETGVVDVVARGEAEMTIWDLVRALDGQIPLGKVKGISYTEQGHLKKTPDAPLVETLDELPWPARHLLPMKEYRKAVDVTQVLMSRGCPYACLFCSCTQMTRHTYRVRSPDDVAREIAHIKDEYYFEKIAFFDDFFTYDREIVLALCSHLQDIHVSWSCATRVDFLDADLLQAMKNAGCFRIFVGAESGNQEVLNKLSKGTRLDNLKEIALYTKELGIELIPSFIIGLPWDTEENILKTIEFSHSLNIGPVWFLPMTPFPGTPFYDNAEKYGIEIVEKDFSRYTTRSIIAVNRFMSLEKLKDLYLDALLKNPRVPTPDSM